MDRWKAISRGSSSSNGTTTRFTQDLVSPLSQILQTTQGTTTKHYVYGHERLYEQAGIVRPWYGSDGLGSVPYVIFRPTMYQ